MTKLLTFDSRVVHEEDGFLYSIATGEWVSPHPDSRGEGLQTACFGSARTSLASAASSAA
jgi:hypothetical protein